MPQQPAPVLGPQGLGSSARTLAVSSAIVCCCSFCCGSIARCNEQKTRVCDGRREGFVFLGYTFGPMRSEKDL